jgi:hypothetical protein
MRENKIEVGGDDKSVEVVVGVETWIGERTCKLARSFVFFLVRNSTG